MKAQYQKRMEELIANLPARFSPAHPPKLLLHSCCAPCSSAVLKRLAPHFKITVFYYNPNINTQNEYYTRVEEQRRLINWYNTSKAYPYPIDCLIKEYKHQEFLTIAKGLEQCKEGGERCFRCYGLRIGKTAHEALKQGRDFFCSTLSLSPLKNAEKINEIGTFFSSPKSQWLPSDFKKKNGYLDSIILSKQLQLYRQDYCGCEYSIREPSYPEAKAL